MSICYYQKTDNKTTRQQEQKNGNNSDKLMKRMISDKKLNVGFAISAQVRVQIEFVNSNANAFMVAITDPCTGQSTTGTDRGR